MTFFVDDHGTRYHTACWATRDLLRRSGLVDLPDDARPERPDLPLGVVQPRP